MTKTTKAKLEVTAEDKTRRAFDSANARMERSIRTAAKYGAALGAAAVAGAGVLTARSLQSVDALAKQADALDVNIGKLRALQLEGELAGISTEKLNTNMERMQRRLGEVARRGGATELALSNIGVNIEDIIDLPADEQLQRLAVSLGGVENAAVRASIANDLFGRDGARMLALLNTLERQGLGPTEQALDSLGVSMSRIDAKQIENANDAMTKAATVAEGFGNRLAIAAAPALEAVATGFFNSAVEAEGWANEIQMGVDIALNVIGVFADALHAVKIAWKGLVVVAATVADGWGKIFDQLSKNWAMIINGIIDLSNMAIEQINKIPGVEIEPIANVKPLEAVTRASEALSASAKQARENLHAALMDELPSNRIKEAYEQAQEASRKAAESAVNNSGDNSGPTPLQQQLEADVVALGAHLAETGAMRQAALQAEADPLKRGTALFNQELDMREAALQSALEKRKAKLQQSLESEVIDEQRHNELLAQVEADHQAKLQELRLEKTNADRLAQELQAFQQSLLSEEQAELLAFERRHEMLNQALEMEFLSKERHKVLLEELELRHQQRMGDIVRDGVSRANEFLNASLSERVKMSADSLIAMTQGLTDGSRAMFEINKAAAIANGLLAAKESVVNAFNFGSRIGGPILGAAFATAAAGFQAIRINQLRATTFGGGTTPSAAGSAPTINNQPVQSAPSIEQQRRGADDRSGASVTVLVPRGELTTTETLRNLLEKLDETAQDMPLRNIRVMEG